MFAFLAGIAAGLCGIVSLLLLRIVGGFGLVGTHLLLLGRVGYGRGVGGGGGGGRNGRGLGRGSTGGGQGGQEGGAEE